MFRAIAAFELKYHLKSPLFYILLLIYFLMTFFAVASDAVTIGGSISSIHRNAPYVVMQILLIMSIFGVLTTTAFVANSVHRDFELGTDALFFSSPIKRWQYLGGRFAGSFIVAVLIYVGVGVSIMLGSFAPWVDKEQLGAFAFEPYVFSLVVLVIPNLLLAGATFFAVAALTRSMMATYSSVVGFFVAYAISNVLAADIENERLAALLDPFGIGAFVSATRYWTVFDKNTRVLSIDGLFLANRLLWIGIALAILAFAFWRFDFTTGTRKSRRKRAKDEAEDVNPIQRFALALPKVTQTFGRGAAWRQYLASVRMESVAVFKSIPFLIMLFLGIFNVWGGTQGSRLLGTEAYPVTRAMIEVIAGSFAVFSLLIAAFYAGDIVWRERSLKLNEVYDATPVPTWAQWGAKFTALLFVIYSTLVVGILTTMVVQTAKGYYNYELGLYAKGVFLQIGGGLVMLAGLAFVMQVVFNQKFVGFLGVMLWFILTLALPALDFEHYLYRFGDSPRFEYSDMNGYGHFVKPLTTFSLYWLLLVAVLFVIGHLLWVRGTHEGLRNRWKIARDRFATPVAATLAVLLAGFVSTGCYIYYNTNILNSYRTSNDGEKLQAAAEKKYKKYQGLPQPRILNAKADVDIHPDRRAVYIRGAYTVQNKTNAPIAELHITFDPTAVQKCSLDIPGARIKTEDRPLGYLIYTLDPPLAPGAQMLIRFATSYEAHGFVNGDENNRVVANGTFIDNYDYFPQLGYSPRIELQDRNKRREHGLPPPQRLKPPTDMKARMEPQLAGTDWMQLDTTVSTSPDQIAIAPGYLQREWTKNGRRYFHYKTTSPILGFWSYLSARYEVKRGNWRPSPLSPPSGERVAEGRVRGATNDPSSAAPRHLLPASGEKGEVPIEIYYDAKHPYNIDQMIYGVQKSLDYFTEHFSPYQHKQVRILEFPKYADFAQSFPNTIPYSESLGFILDLRNKTENLDYVFYITAHEIAHQWWAHQVIGGDVQGSTMITETLAQYSALMVMEKEYGKAQMRKFLRYELDRYLEARGDELIAEMPLMLVENQGYIHYRKGSLAMYALRDYIGEERVNRALAKFIRDHAFKGAPYPTATELVAYFKAEAPAKNHEVIADLFERITLFDLQTREASATKRADGKYVVKMTVASTKLRSDAKGEEKPVTIDDWIDIGVLAGKDDDKVLFLEKRRITKPTETFEVVVNEKPSRAGIDPFNKLIDRNPKDNTKGL